MAHGPDLAKCLVRRDFSVGFYTTRVRSQAEEFANEKFRKMAALYRHNGMNVDPDCAAVVELSIDRNALGQLDTLAFVFGEDDWKVFVDHCRAGGLYHKPGNSNYDVVYGPVSTATGEWWKFEQLSFHSGRAISLLKRVGLYLGRPRL